MASSHRFRLPSGKDWAWLLALIIGGGLLGYCLNAVSFDHYQRTGSQPQGINLRSALELDDPAPQAQPTAEPTPQPAPPAKPQTRSAGPAAGVKS